MTAPRGTFYCCHCKGALDDQGDTLHCAKCNHSWACLPPGITPVEVVDLVDGGWPFRLPEPSTNSQT